MTEFFFINILYKLLHVESYIEYRSLHLLSEHHASFLKMLRASWHATKLSRISKTNVAIF